MQFIATAPLNIRQFLSIMLTFIHRSSYYNYIVRMIANRHCRHKSKNSVVEQNESQILARSF
jgi:hypothetical protein